VRRVSWKGVFVREYNCTVGDHPMCSDNLPLTLDWSHSGEEQVKSIECSQERQANYRFPRRLSHEERKNRVAGGEETSGVAWVRPAALGALQVEELSLMDLDVEIDSEENSAEQSVIYCRHALAESEDVEDDGYYFFDWRRLADF